jgi:hypothetical protein
VAKLTQVLQTQVLQTQVLQTQVLQLLEARPSVNLAFDACWLSYWLLLLYSDRPMSELAHVIRSQVSIRSLSEEIAGISHTHGARFSAVFSRLRLPGPYRPIFAARR